MSRIGGCPPCKGIHGASQAGQVTRGSMAVVAIWSVPRRAPLAHPS
jgi:hypothetical protein